MPTQVVGRPREWLLTRRTTQVGRVCWQSGIQRVKISCQHLQLWLAFNCEAQRVSKQHGGERGHISTQCSQSSFPASHVDSMMASRGVLCSYEILNLLSPHVQTDHLQASVACGESEDQMSLSNTLAQTHAKVCRACTEQYPQQSVELFSINFSCCILPW